MEQEFILAKKYGISERRANEILKLLQSKQEVAQQGMQYNYQKSGDRAIAQQDVDRINKNTSIQFTPDFAKSYFSTASTPIAKQQTTDYSQMPVLDITSDGQWTDRKVWRNQRPEWFVGKQEPMEGRDYTTVPYKQWGEYQKGQEYQKFSGNNQQLAEMQQGGKIETLANKYGISMERAQELMSYQQGGEIPQEQGEVSQENQMQQVFQAVAEMLQQGMQPEQVAEQLIQMGVPEEQVGQLIQEVAQQLQGQQQEAMQYGGEKEYMQSAGYKKIVDQNIATGTNSNVPSLGGENWQKGYYDNANKWETYLGATPTKFGTHLDYQTNISKNLNPQLIQLIKDNEIPFTNNTRSLLKSAGIKDADKKLQFSDLTEEERKKVGDDILVKGYNDGLAGHRGVQVLQGDMTQEDYAKASGKYDKKTDVEGRQIYAKYDKDGKLLRDDKGKITFYYPKKAGEPEKKVDPSKIADETKEPYTEQPNQEVESRTNVKNVMPNFGTYIPLFSPMQSIAKESIEIPRMDAIKTTVEPFLAEQERQRLTDVERIEQAGMSPQQTEALLAQGLSSSQMASNDAIAKVEQYNAQNQFQADQYNLGARSKEDIMNAQFRQNFQDKSMQTLANNEESMRNQYRSNFLQEQSNANKVINMNTANALNDNFAVTPSGVEFLNNKPYELPNNTLELLKNYDKMTPAERIAFIKSHSKLA